jgi:NADPH-dependent F420 reductase
MTFEVGIAGGTGAEGRGLAARLARAGARVLLGSRDAQRARRTAAELLETGAGLAIEPTDNPGAFAAADYVLLAVPFAGVADTIRDGGSRLRPQALVVDVSVPLRFERGAPPRLLEVPEGSAAEHVRKLLPPAVSLAVAFKTIPARLLGDLERPLDCDEFVCGDSQEARTRALELLARLPGLRGLDAGGLESARVIERLTLLAVVLNKRYRSHETRFRAIGIET